MRSLWTAAALAALLALGACAEKAQTLAPRKADSKAWDAAQNGFVTSGWKAGDQVSWEDQMRARAQSQNEYVRAAAKPQ
jgi:hypothetical protein